MKMLRYPIIAADLFTVNVGTAEQRKVLLDEALAHRNSGEDNMAFTNEGCWRSQFVYQDIEWLMVHLKELTNAAITISARTIRLLEKCNTLANLKLNIGLM